VLLLGILGVLLGRGRLLFDGREETSHVEGKVGEGVVVGYCVNRSHINTFLGRIRSDVIPNLLEQMKDLSATEICWRSPLLRPRAAKEDLGQEVVMNSISAKAMSSLMLVLRKLDSQINVPDLLP
jgi:hypothetical protein